VEKINQRSVLLLNEKKRGVRSCNETIYIAYATYGYTLKEIADYLGVHYATVNRAIKRVKGCNKSW
jgi:transposase